jgi:hypothetical protein
MLVMLPMFIIGSRILRSVSEVIEGDIAQVWRSTATRAELLYQRRQGESALLLIRGVEAGYSGRRVLHGVDMERRGGRDRRPARHERRRQEHLAEGDQRCRGGRPWSHRVRRPRDHPRAAQRDRRFGITQMPGGQGVFGGLTVRENLELSGWTRRRDPDGVAAATAEVIEMFPILGQRMEDSGGQPVGRAATDARPRDEFIARPRVLLIDELSLGLAPVVVGQLLPIVERMAADGTPWCSSNRA